MVSCFGLSCSISGSETIEWVTVHPEEDTSAVLHNPDMGYVLYENYPLDQRPGGSSTLLVLPQETFPGVDHVAIMFSWYDIEHRPGVYDFSKADFAYDCWRKRGKQIQLRLSTESLLWWNTLNPPSGKGVPDYVLDRLAPDKKQARVEEGFPYTVVDARDPYYQTRLRAFLAATASHFSRQRAVTLVDLRGYGLWGEWHRGFQYRNLDEKREALKRIIDAYSEAFSSNTLSLSYSFDPDSPKAYWDGPVEHYDAKYTSTYNDFLHYSAFDYALTIRNVSWRRDGVGGSVHSNERKLCEEAFRLGRAPMMCEFHGGYADAKPGGQRWLEWKVDDALSLHPNYINMLGYSGGDMLGFMREQPELVAKGLRGMGYRLVPVKVSFAKSLKSGASLTIRMEWVNRGVGRTLRDYSLKVLFLDPSGRVACESEPQTLKTSSWIKGETYPTSLDAVFDKVPAGQYRLCMAMTDPATSQTVALPLKKQISAGTYEIGEVNCLGAD